ncbi:MAG: hypothetical protein WDW38_002388 [Sanguina aurantia]
MEVTKAGGMSQFAQETVHHSAHPTLAPAHPNQVVQYLLANNYYLTALELLVESQQAGHGDQVLELEAFFSDADKFPPRGAAQAPGCRCDQSSIRHMDVHTAMNIQAAAREREERLQLVEYELRLAKEDLGVMNKRVAQQQQQQQQQQPRQSSSSSLSEKAPPPADATAGCEDSQRDPSAGSMDEVPAVALTSPTSHDVKVLNSAVISYLSQRGYRMAAMTLQEEAAGETAEGASSGNEAQLWTWYSGSTRLCGRCTWQPGLAPAHAPHLLLLVMALLDLAGCVPPTSAPAAPHADASLRAELAQAQALIAQLQQQAQATATAAAIAAAHNTHRPASIRTSVQGMAAVMPAAEGGWPQAALLPPLLPLLLLTQQQQQRQQQ